MTNLTDLTDLTEYSDAELSLWVMNDEYLYSIRHRPYLREILEEIFIFTDEQWEELQNDLNEEGN